MIIKFDHVSYSCSYENETKAIDHFIQMDAYKVMFKETSLKNISCKKNLMQRPHYEHHLTFLQPLQAYYCPARMNQLEYEGGGILPIEITSYPQCTGEPSWNLMNNNLEYITDNIEESKMFLKLVGFKVISDDCLTLTTIFDKQPITLKLTRCIKKKISALDMIGFTSIALIVDNLDNYIRKINQNNYTAAKEECIIVNKKELKISFAKGPCGEIIELIGVR